MQRKYFLFKIMLIVLAVSVSSCQDEELDIILQNDCIKRSICPNIVDEYIEFVYAMALPQSAGKILSAQVEASITGAPETWMEHRSYHTNNSGQDVGIPIGDPSVNSDNTTKVTFTRDTCAAALRYYYVIPEEARGKKVSFTFTAKASNGETISYPMGPYDITTMHMKLDIPVSEGNLCYISLADMKAYNAADAAAKATNIDLVYLYRNISGINFGHALVAPGANAEYLPDITLPAGVNGKSRLKKVWDLQDKQLARLQYGVYVDDLDFVKLDMTNMPDYSINLKAESGVWVETEDGKYRAYIFVNAVNNTSRNATISIKRYTVN
ncbi:MAG: DUF4466 family protein [Mangrovibacterium sp.]